MSVIEGRHTASYDGDLVVFLIGTRINSLRAVRQWLPVVRAMSPMLRELSKDPESGLARVLPAVVQRRRLRDLARDVRRTGRKHRNRLRQHAADRPGQGRRRRPGQPTRQHRIRTATPRDGGLIVGPRHPEPTVA
jgi:Domain of unknown function (DUF4188)